MINHRIYVCLSFCICPSACVCLCLDVCLCSNACARVYVRVRVRTCLCMCTGASMCVCTSALMCDGVFRQCICVSARLSWLIDSFYVVRLCLLIAPVYGFLRFGKRFSARSTRHWATSQKISRSFSTTPWDSIKTSQRFTKTPRVCSDKWTQRKKNWRSKTKLTFGCKCRGR